MTMNFTYAEIKTVIATLQSEAEPLGAWLNKQPRGAMGLTLDSVKQTKEWQDNYKAFHKLQAQIRKAVSYKMKHYKKESRKEREENRAAKIAANLSK